VNPRVLHLRSSIGVYGAEGVILGLLPQLNQLGLPTELLCLAHPGKPMPELLDRAVALGVSAAPILCRGLLDWSTVAKLRANLRSRPRTIVHVHDYKTAFYAWLARSGQAVPIVATNHGQFKDSARVRLYNQLELKLLSRFEQVCMVSSGMRTQLEKAGIRPDRLAVIDNGIDIDHYRPGLVAMDLAAWQLPPDAFVFGTAMRLCDVKNPMGLVEAFAAATAGLTAPTALLVAGEGPLRSALLARIADLGLQQRVHLLGALPDLTSFYAALDAFVLPSLSEGLPLALLEAMACELPVVVSNVGEVPQVLAGLGMDVLPPGDVLALARAMRAMAVARPGPQASLRERVVARYSVQRMAADYASIYRRLTH
jgi:glycosyltransferase involved in cell wall biosynthesis